MILVVIRAICFVLHFRTNGSNAHFLASGFIVWQEPLGKMFKGPVSTSNVLFPQKKAVIGSRKKFGRERSLRAKSQRSLRTAAQSMTEDETIVDKSARIESIMKSTRQSVKPGAQEKALVYRFVKKIMEKGVRGLRTEFFQMKRLVEY
ncbi:hypothetical protein OESDEN_07576 [Oesophagostomum dentatum]|uniref:Uncharacterized protein n=1 Tax=Oesophagostomum dentatum TaxID=61180 RepID=A0A0B1T5L5_OESDE|nr:hypothetical protein OESDEN_07576 [Oesophagostomum dentatum]